MPVKTDEHTILRKHLAEAVEGVHAHLTFAQALQDFPVEARGKKIPGSPHTSWQLLEHMRIAQRDILDFSRDPRHKSPPFPEGYWPHHAAPPNELAWQQSASAFANDQREFAELLGRGDLFTRFEHGDGQNLLREAIVLANHNSYHLGQLVLLKRMLTAAT